MAEQDAIRSEQEEDDDESVQVRLTFPAIVPPSQFVNNVVTNFTGSEMYVTFSHIDLPPRLPGGPVPPALMSGELELTVVARLVMTPKKFGEIADVFQRAAEKLRASDQLPPPTEEGTGDMRGRS